MLCRSSKTTLFIFSEPPKITIAPKDTKVLDKSMVVFYCEASGYPEPKLYWGEITGPYAYLHEPMYLTQSKLALRIPKVQLELNADTYTCWAENEYGQAKAEATLTVYTNDNGKKNLIAFYCSIYHSNLRGRLKYFSLENCVQMSLIKT